MLQRKRQIEVEETEKERIDKGDILHFIMY